VLSGQWTESQKPELASVTGHWLLITGHCSKVSDNQEVTPGSTGVSRMLRAWV